MVSSDGRVRHKILDSTMNSERYLQILNEIVLPLMTSNRYNQHLFMQDGAPVHCSVNVRKNLNEKLADSWIGRSGPIEWPPRSPDLTLCDFWLRSYMRDFVFKHPSPTNLEELITRSEQIFSSLQMDMIRKTFKSFVKRCKLCVEHNGEHFESFNYFILSIF